MSNNLPEPITREEMYLDAILKNGGGGGGSSAEIEALQEAVGDLDDLTTTAKTNLVDAVNEIDAKTEPFFVALTPTAADYSGVMNKSGDEILAAYLAGKTIVFVIPSMLSSVVATQFSFYYHVDEGGHSELYSVKAVANIIFSPDGGSTQLLIQIITNADTLTYDTNIFPLTLMS